MIHSASVTPPFLTCLVIIFTASVDTVKRHLHPSVRPWLFWSFSKAWFATLLRIGNLMQEKATIPMTNKTPIHSAWIERLWEAASSNVSMCSAKILHCVVAKIVNLAWQNTLFRGNSCFKLYIKLCPWTSTVLMNSVSNSH